MTAVEDRMDLDKVGAVSLVKILGDVLKPCRHVEQVEADGVEEAHQRQLHQHYRGSTLSTRRKGKKNIILKSVDPKSPVLPRLKFYLMEVSVLFDAAAKRHPTPKLHPLALPSLLCKRQLAKMTNQRWLSSPVVLDQKTQRMLKLLLTTTTRAVRAIPRVVGVAVEVVDVGADEVDVVIMVVADEIMGEVMEVDEESLVVVVAVVVDVEIKAKVAVVTTMVIEIMVVVVVAAVPKKSKVDQEGVKVGDAIHKEEGEAAGMERILNRRKMIPRRHKGVTDFTLRFRAR